MVAGAGETERLLLVVDPGVLELRRPDDAGLEAAIDLSPLFDEVPLPPSHLDPDAGVAAGYAAAVAGDNMAFVVFHLMTHSPILAGEELRGGLLAAVDLAERKIAWWRPGVFLNPALDERGMLYLLLAGENERTLISWTPEGTERFTTPVGNIWGIEAVVGARVIADGQLYSTVDGLRTGPALPLVDHVSYSVATPDSLWIAPAGSAATLRVSLLDGRIEWISSGVAAHNMLIGVDGARVLLDGHRELHGLEPGGEQWTCALEGLEDYGFIGLRDEVLIVLGHTCETCPPVYRAYDIPGVRPAPAGAWSHRDGDFRRARGDQW